MASILCNMAHLPESGVPTKVTLLVEGMQCTACSDMVKNVLQAMPGVTSTSCSLLANQAQARTRAA